MNKLLALLTIGLVASAAVADIPPPPPPKGMKYVAVSNEVVLGKDVTGYVFVQQVGAGLGLPNFTYEKLKLTADNPTAVAAGGRRTSVTLFAVPQDAAKEFKTDADLFAALGEGKVKGVQRLGFNSTATVPDAVKNDPVKWTHTITAIDAKGGIKKKVEGEGAPKSAGKPGKDAPEDDGDERGDTPAAHAPRGGVWVAGVAAFAAVTLGGFWLAGRTRRKP